MTGKAIDVFESQSAAGQNAGDRRRDVRLRERRDRSVENDAEALRIDSPAHDVERVGPGVLTAHLNDGGAAVVSLKHAGRGAVPEQRRGDNIRLGQFIEAEGQGANLDRDQQHDAAGTRAGEAGRNREPGDAAGAAKAEDGNPLDVGAKPHAPGDPRLETGRRNPGR